MSLDAYASKTKNKPSKQSTVDVVKDGVSCMCKTGRS